MTDEYLGFVPPQDVGVPPIRVVEITPTTGGEPRCQCCGLAAADPDDPDDYCIDCGVECADD